MTEFNIKNSLAMSDNNAPIITDFSAKSSILLIAFGGIAGGFIIPPFEFFKISKDLNIKKLFIRDNQQAWYHYGLSGIGKDIDEIAVFLKKTIKDQNINHVVITGNSMGGYAAILFGYLVGADVVHAFSPQTFIDEDNRKLYSDTRWELQIKGVFSSQTKQEKYFDLEAVMRQTTSKCIFNIHFAADNELDRNHACRLSNIKNVNLCRYDKGGHNVVSNLKANGQLKELLINSLFSQKEDLNKDRRIKVTQIPLIKILNIKEFQNQEVILGFGIKFPIDKNYPQKSKLMVIPSLIYSDYLPIEGWILGRNSPVNTIEIKWKDILIGQSPVNLSRKDIQSKFPDTDISRAGFFMRFHTDYLPKEAEISIYAVMENGEAVKFLEITFSRSIEVESHQQNNFLILFNGRCGSTYLIELLRKHPEIESYMEKLYQYDNLEQQCCFIDSFFGAKRVNYIKAVGLKEQLFNIVEPEKTINYMVSNYDPKIYVMSRANVVKTAVSMLRAMTLKKIYNVSNVRDENHKLSMSNIPPEKLMQAIQYREKLDAKLNNLVEKLNLDVVKIYYEDLLHNRDSFLNSIFLDLEVELIKIQGDTVVKKNTSDNLKEALSNFEEIVNYFSGTKYEEMLLEGVK